MQKLFLSSLILFLLIVNHQECNAAATDPPPDSCVVVRDTACAKVVVMFVDSSQTTSGQTQPEETFRKKKLITSILAFPIPFGFMGLHRIYLGSSPWVPVAYLCTGGGGLGLLPLIDFIFIVTANEEEFKKYENNPNLFMFAE